MTRIRWFLLLAGLVVGLIISSRFLLLAQDRAGTARANRDHPRQTSPAKGPETVPRPEQQSASADGQTSAAPTIQDALLRPYRFAFARPTPLEQVCAHLKETLKISVVLDRAALDRQNVEPADTVSLELESARLKTGLKLLLDQLGLTYRVVPEDNLLVITDREGSEDPNERIWTELRALHRDVHDLQDAVDELREFLGDETGEGPRAHKPTIVEETPENRDEKRADVPEKQGRAREKPEGAPAPGRGSRPNTPRVPLANPRRSL
jgi:hypothetical protein